MTESAPEYIPSPEYAAVRKSAAGSVDEPTRLRQLAALCQRWGEICEQQVRRDTPVMQAYLKGRADAHRFDAQRARDLAAGETENAPLDRATVRYMIEMMYQAVGGGEGEDE